MLTFIARGIGSITPPAAHAWLAALDRHPPLLLRYRAPKPPVRSADATAAALRHRRP